MPKRERYVLAAFNIDEDNAIMYRKYFTIPGLNRCFKHAIDAIKADYISLRIIRPKEIRR